MYSHELKEFIKSKNYTLGGDEIIEVISTEKNPQLVHIKYNAYGNSYDMWDNKGDHFHFNTIPYEEAVSKGKVKVKKL